jgi:hypothetical protein
MLTPVFGMVAGIVPAGMAHGESGLARGAFNRIGRLDSRMMATRTNDSLSPLARLAWPMSAFGGKADITV